MSELQITGSLLLVVCGWIFITIVVKDIVLTARFCLADIWQNDGSFLFQRPSGFWLLSLLLYAVKSGNVRRAFLARLNIIFPLLQVIIWKGLMIAGFALLYLAVNWQTQIESIPESVGDEVYSSLWLSFAVSFRLSLYELSLNNQTIFLFANIQFYSGFLFYGFICFYLLALSRKSRQIKPRLYRLRFELDSMFYSPFRLGDALLQYRTNNLLLILQDWEEWAQDININLRAHPHLIYAGIKTDQGISWLSALKIVLDTSAALIVSTDGAVEEQARRTFGSARRALVGITEFLGSLDSSFSLSSQPDRAPVSDALDVLSAELIVERESPPRVQANEREALELWRITYLPYIQAISDYLNTEIEEDGYKQPGD